MQSKCDRETTCDHRATVAVCDRATHPFKGGRTSRRTSRDLECDQKIQRPTSERRTLSTDALRDWERSKRRRPRRPVQRELDFGGRR